MKRSVLICSVLLYCFGSAGSKLEAQIAVKGGGDYNRLTTSGPVPESDDMQNAGDLFLENDLELTGQIYLDGELYMDRDATFPVGGDQVIFFADDQIRSGEEFGWNESRDAFEVTDDFFLSTGGRLQSLLLSMESETPLMTFLIDSDANDDAGQIPHTFTWYNNNLNAGSRAMELRSTGPSPDLGNLTIAGTLTSNGFDLAEMFLAASAAEPGQLVAVDDSRPDAVRPALANDGGRLLGIVATAPAVVLGGGAFSADALRAQWGDEVAAEFELQRPAIEAELYAEIPGLREVADSLVSTGAFAASLGDRYSAAPEIAELVSDGQERALPPRPELRGESELQEAYAAALVLHETRLFDAVMARFAERRFARVALSGRVPVRVDASFGPIEPGDPLTASPIPGVAMRAQEAGWVVGTALEAKRAGSGTILALVDRGWFGGDDDRGRLASLEAELAELKDALASLDLRVLGPRTTQGRAMPGESTPRQSSR